MTLPFQISLRADDAGCHVRCVGELDVASAREYRSAVRSTVLGCATVHIDLADISFVDSAGLRALILAHRDATSAGQHVHYVALAPGVQRLLEITGLLDVFGLDDEAIGSTADEPLGSTAPAPLG